MAKVSLEKDKIKFLLVEGVHQKALESLALNCPTTGMQHAQHQTAV